MTVLTVLVALFIGQLVKGATGFGGSLTALPILAIVLPPGPAILVVSGTDIIAGGWLAWHARREAMPKLWWVMILPFFAGQWAGTGLLTTWPVDTTKQVLAVLVALFGLDLLRPACEGYENSASSATAPCWGRTPVVGVIGGLQERQARPSFTCADTSSTPWPRLRSPSFCRLHRADADARRPRCRGRGLRRVAPAKGCGMLGSCRRHVHPRAPGRAGRLMLAAAAGLMVS